MLKQWKWVQRVEEKLIRTKGEVGVGVGVGGWVEVKSVRTLQLRPPPWGRLATVQLLSCVLLFGSERPSSLLFIISLTLYWSWWKFNDNLPCVCVCVFIWWWWLFIVGHRLFFLIHCWIESEMILCTIHIFFLFVSFSLLFLLCLRSSRAPRVSTEFERNGRLEGSRWG